jgi:TonB-dependent receptor
MLGASIFALGLGAVAPVLAQTTPAPTDQTQAKVDNTVVVVTARRKAIQNATERKKNSDTIIDSVVADEAGKLPDTSITEVLQRVAGVTMERFASPSSPDQFSFEGSGIQVRGLSGVTGLLNGREVFSANGGSGLNWGQVTPEMMAAVDVYKASDSDLIEGGLGGAVDLRTRMPFDYKKPQIDATLTDSYGDLSRKSSPSASLLLTDRWDTPVGNMGLLIDLAQADYKDEDSFVRTEPYYKEVNSGVTTYTPGGFDYGNDTYDRKRTGLYEAFQWRPFDGLTIWQTVFSSTYKQTNGGGGVFVVMGANPVATNATYDKNGVFQSGTLNANGYTATNATTFSPGSANNYTPSTDTTADFSQGFSWAVSDKFKLNGALQYVDSWYFGQDYGMGIGTGINLGAIGMNVTGSLPHDTIANSATLMTTAATAAPNSIIWNQQRHHAHMTAVNLDGDYELGDGFFKEFKAGARYADRAESDSFVGTWWSAINESWDGKQHTVATSPAADWSVYTFPNFFNGKIAVPGNYILSSPKTVICPTCLAHDISTYALGSEFPNAASSYTAANIAPSNNTLTTTRVQTADVYGEVKFGSDRSWFNSPFTGNFGIRVVYNKVQSDGQFSVSSTGPFYLNAADAASSLAQVGGTVAAANAWQTAHPGALLPLTYQLTAAQAPTKVPLRGDFSYTRALPSLNLSFKPDSTFIWRLAINQTISPPSYGDDAVGGSVGLQSLSTNPGNIGYSGSNPLPGIFNGFSGNLKTELKPEISTNEDLSFEWYPSTSTTYHFDLFNKDIKDLIVYNYETVGVTETYYNGTTPTPVSANEQVLQDFNATQTSTVTGFEIGGRKFFDTLPGLWSGLGVEANYTRVDSHSPDQFANDMNGNPMKNIPIPLLSNDSFNIAFLYDKGDWDARLSYNWRSAYMAGVGNGTNGSYTPNGGSNINYNLPVYADSFGQLDGSASYRINDHWKVALQVSNILDGIPKTKMEILQGVFETRSWFLEDRRYQVSLHMSY